MSEYFVRAGEFWFPDHLFPETALPGVAPDNPGQTLAHLQREYTALRDVPVDKAERRLFSWARSLLAFAELYGGVPPALVSYAKSVVVAISESSLPSSGHALYIRGNWHLFGLLDFPIDGSRGRDLFRTAIKRRYVRAWYRMGASAEARGDATSGLGRYESGASMGDIACKYRLGMAHILGDLGLSKNVQRGIELFVEASKGADNDFPQPAYVLGKIYLGEMGSLLGEGGVLVQQFVAPSKGLALMEKAALLGFAPAQLRMAMAYQGAEKGHDCTKALRFLHLAARQEQHLIFQKAPPSFGGEPESQIVKWLLVGYDNVIARNEEWAFRFATAAAEQHNPTAQFALGYFAEVGINCEPNLKLATQYYEMSARQSCKAAQVRLEKLNGSLPRQTSLRRTLTRQDHEKTLNRHRGQLTGPVNTKSDIKMLAVDALNEEDPEQPPREATHVSPYPVSPEPKPVPDSEGSALPYPASPSCVAGGSTTKLPYPTDGPARISVAPATNTFGQPLNSTPTPYTLDAGLDTGRPPKIASGTSKVASDDGDPVQHTTQAAQTQARPSPTSPDQTESANMFGGGIKTAAPPKRGAVRRKPVERSVSVPSEEHKKKSGGHARSRTMAPVDVSNLGSGGSEVPMVDEQPTPTALEPVVTPLPAVVPKPRPYPDHPAPMQMNGIENTRSNASPVRPVPVQVGAHEINKPNIVHNFGSATEAARPRSPLKKFFSRLSPERSPSSSPRTHADPPTKPDLSRMSQPVSMTQQAGGGHPAPVLERKGSPKSPHHRGQSMSAIPVSSPQKQDKRLVSMPPINEHEDTVPNPSLNEQPRFVPGQQGKDDSPISRGQPHGSGVGSTNSPSSAFNAPSLRPISPQKEHEVMAVPGATPGTEPQKRPVSTPSKQNLEQNLEQEPRTLESKLPGRPVSPNRNSLHSPGGPPLSGRPISLSPRVDSGVDHGLDAKVRRRSPSPHRRGESMATFSSAPIATPEKRLVSMPGGRQSPVPSPRGTPAIDMRASPVPGGRGSPDPASVRPGRGNVRQETTISQSPSRGYRPRSPPKRGQSMAVGGIATMKPISEKRLASVPSKPQLRAPEGERPTSVESADHKNAETQDAVWISPLARPASPHRPSSPQRASSPYRPASPHRRGQSMAAGGIATMKPIPEKRLASVPSKAQLRAPEGERPTSVEGADHTNAETQDAGWNSPIGRPASPHRPSSPQPPSSLYRPASPHRRGQSMAVGATVPERPVEKRLTSMPLRTGSPAPSTTPSTAPSDRLPGRRPGVAYTFEEMGIKTVTADNTGKCVVQ